MILVCDTCGKEWKGRTEYDAEVAMSADPCECEKALEGLSLQELRELCLKGAK
jgi:hypothetical protein